MPPTPPDYDAITTALQNWRQGDVILDSDLAFIHIARLSQPLTDQANLAAQELPAEEGDSDLAPVFTQPPGFILLTQTCDIVRDCKKRPYIELAPLVEMPEQEVEHIRRLKYPCFAYVPALAARRLVADLDRTFTVEKAVLTPLTRLPGFADGQEASDFAEALSRKRSRFAFPDDFHTVLKKFTKRFQDRAGKQSPEGLHVDAVREIRVSAQPSWDAETIQLTFWFIKDRNPTPQQWNAFLGQWETLLDQSGRYKIGEPFHIVDIDDITAKDYVESQRLDYDQLSPP